MSDILVISATLEHIENWQITLKNIFDTSTKLIVIRTFIGEQGLKQICKKPNSQDDYIIRQFTENDIINRPDQKKWNLNFVADQATQEKPKEECQGITRTMKI